MLTQSGLTSMEQQLVRSVMSNDLSDLKKLAATLRDQFGAVHDREKRKGKGDQKGRWGWGQRSSYMAESYMAEDENPVVTDETTENAEYDEELYDENYEEMPEGPEGTQLEEDIVAWYADQGIHAQTCSAEDLELIHDTVEHCIRDGVLSLFLSRFSKIGGTRCRFWVTCCRPFPMLRAYSPRGNDS